MPLIWKSNDYPATYVEDSIKFQSAFLVGEIRNYDGDWNALKGSYASKPLEVGDSIILPVWSLPLRIYRNDQTSGLDFPRTFSLDPCDANVLHSRQEDYNSGKMSQLFDGMKGSIYFVYVTVEP